MTKDKDKAKSKDTEKNTSPSNATPTGMLNTGGQSIPILGSVDDQGKVNWGK